MADNESSAGAPASPATAPAAANGATPPPAPGAEGAPTDAEVAAGATERDEKGRFRNPLQPRIDELTRARRQAERETAYWRGLAEAKANPPPEPPKKPEPANFETYEAYTEALAEFKAGEIVERELGKREVRAQEQTEAQRRAQTWHERSLEAAKTIPDLEAVLAASEVNVADHVTAQLLDSELGPQIAYHLDKNPEIAERWNGMSEAQVAKEIGKLELQLAPAAPAAEAEADERNVTRDSTPPPAPVQNRRVSSAPPPMKPVGQGRSTTVDMAKMNMEDYVKLRREQKASWAR